MPHYITLPDKLYLVRDKLSSKYRTGTHSSAVPKLYKHSPGLISDEELVLVEIYEIVETEEK